MLRGVLQHVGLLQGLEGDLVTGDLGEFAQAHFLGDQRLHGGEAELRQTTLQRHLTALEAGLDAAAAARLLALVAAAAGLAQTGADATTDALLGVLGARCRAQAIEFHGLLSLNARSEERRVGKECRARWA